MTEGRCTAHGMMMKLLHNFSSPDLPAANLDFTCHRQAELDRHLQSFHILSYVRVGVDDPTGIKRGTAISDLEGGDFIMSLKRPMANPG